MKSYEEQELNKEFKKTSHNANEMINAPVDELDPESIPTEETKGTLRVTNFRCSEHGLITPVPKCPNCPEKAYELGRAEMREEVEKMCEGMIRDIYANERKMTLSEQGAVRHMDVPMTSQTKCCELCSGTIVNHSTEEMEVVCENPSCPCHQTKYCECELEGVCCTTHPCCCPCHRPSVEKTGIHSDNLAEVVSVNTLEGEWIPKDSPSVEESLSFSHEITGRVVASNPSVDIAEEQDGDFETIKVSEYNKKFPSVETRELAEEVRALLHAEREKARAEERARIVELCIETVNNLEKSYLIQDSSRDGEIVKASHTSRTMTFVAVREALSDLRDKLTK